MTNRPPIFFREHPGPNSGHGRLTYDPDRPRFGFYSGLLAGMVLGGIITAAGHWIPFLLAQH